MLRTGHLLRPASNPASRPRTGASLPGTLASPRTGLAPAGCPQLVAWLRHHNMILLVVMAPKLLDALPYRRVCGDRQEPMNRPTDRSVPKTQPVITLWTVATMGSFSPTPSSVRIGISVGPNASKSAWDSQMSKTWIAPFDSSAQW